MPTYRSSIQTPAGPAEAFAYLSRFDRAAEWDPGVEQGEMLTPEPVGIGSRFRLVARFLGRPCPSTTRSSSTSRTSGSCCARRTGSVRLGRHDHVRRARRATVRTLVRLRRAARRQGHRAARRPAARRRLPPHRRPRRGRPARRGCGGAGVNALADRARRLADAALEATRRRQLQPHRIRGPPCAVRLGCRAALST